ncbi:hypothetical protein [Acetobacter conturbans]|uniref:Uncharacterized protein n=1 Tax=Acetobacter conturbans TaxID=1737472 RepID=A0ABX0K417_9PROT|nr:hypothetical protein [Acetobacter conturbans]NHN89967.1 hypothetical protein [Acetobacter conturbans]
MPRKHCYKAVSQHFASGDRTANERRAATIKHGAVLETSHSVYCRQHTHPLPHEAMLLICVVLVLALIVAPAAVAAPDPLSDECLVDSIVTPLLGGNGDSPIIPVSIDGKSAAMYVNPAADEIYVRDAENIEFPYEARHARVLINGTHIENASRSVIYNLVVGDIRLKNVAVVRLDTPSTQSVSGRPIVGILGRTALSRMIVMIDIPDRKFAFLRYKDTKQCEQPGPIDRLVGRDVNSVPLNTDFTIPVTLSGETRQLELDPDLHHITVPHAWLSRLQKKTARAPYTQVSARYDDFVDKGVLASVDNIQIGQYNSGPQNVVFQENWDTAGLGLPFFEHKVVFFDYPKRRLYFAERDHTKPLPSGRNLHFFRVVISNVDINENTGLVR